MNFRNSTLILQEIEQEKWGINFESVLISEYIDFMTISFHSLEPIRRASLKNYFGSFPSLIAILKKF